jgi:hypothetical protein
MNQHEDHLDNYDIPDPEDVQTGGPGFPNWRPAEGKLVMGREEDGTLVECPGSKIVGRLLRVGIHDVEPDKGDPYTKVECELETSAGKQGVGVKTTSKLATCNLAAGLLAAAKGELIAIEAVPGTKKNRYGKFGTFINIYSVNPVTKATKRIFDKSIADIFDLDDRLETALEKLREHPAYADRPKRQDSDPWQALIDCVESHKRCAWPHPLDVVTAYLELCSDASEEITGTAKRYGMPAEIDAAVLHSLIDAINASPEDESEVPDSLLEAAKAAKAKPSGAFKKRA